MIFIKFYIDVFTLNNNKNKNIDEFVEKHSNDVICQYEYKMFV
jgi:hypothetical protein